MRPDDGRRAGFTMLELLLALSMVGLLLLSVRMVLDQLGDEGARISARKEERDAQHNGLRLLKQLLRKAEAGTDSGSRFIGDETQISFTTWCAVPAGWLERCRVSLQVVPEGNGMALAAIVPGQTVRNVYSDPRTGVFRYFDALSATDPWTRSWGISIRPPGAVGVVLGADTVVLPVTGR